MNNKGFTLAEMLIVVVIIGILIATIVPTIMSSLELAREATDLANIRQICSELSQLVILGDSIPSNFYNDTKGNIIRACILCEGKKAGWQTKNLTMNGSGAIINGSICYAPATDKPYLCIKIDKSTGVFTFVREDKAKPPLYK